MWRRPGCWTRSAAIEEDAPVQPARLIPGQPGTQRLPDHARLLGDDRHVMTVDDQRQNCLTALFCHAQLSHRASVKDQPKQLSSVNRNTVAHHPTLISPSIRRNNTNRRWGGGARTHDPGIMSQVARVSATNGLDRRSSPFGDVRQSSQCARVRPRTLVARRFVPTACPRAVPGDRWTPRDAMCGLCPAGLHATET
jgi:hypothetical protein